MMNVFRLQPVSEEDGEFAPAWFDDELYLWDDERLHKSGSLVNNWTAPNLQLVHPDLDATKVLFNPNALAVSESVKGLLCAIPGIEFLPVHIKGHPSYFLLHVAACIPLPEGSKHRRAPAPSGNIVEVFSFSKDYAPPNPVFRILQPPDSAAGRERFCFHTIYLNQHSAEQFETACKGLLKAMKVQQGG